MNLDWTYPRTMTAPSLDPRLREDFADLARAGSHIARVLPLDEEPFDLSIFNVWWIPEKSFEVIYEMTRASGRREIVTLKFVPEGEARSVCEATRARVLDPASVHILANWSAVLVRFPNDEAMRVLPRALDLDDVARTIARGSGEGAEITAWSLLSYLPRDRASICYALGAGSQKAAGKLHSTARATHAAMQALWHVPARAFRIPEPVAFDPDLGMRWERFISGQRIDLAGDRNQIDRQLQRTLADLAALHAVVSLDGLPTNGRAEVLARIERKVMRRIERALPHAAGRAGRLMALLSRGAEALPSEPHVTMHGDFHTGNVLFDGDEPGFIDLDNLAFGEAAYDLALFASRLLLTEIVTGARLEGLGGLIEDLPRRYRAAGGAPVADALFAWYMAALLVGRQLKTCIRHVAPGLPQIADHLFEAAETILEDGRFRAGALACLRAP